MTPLSGKTFVLELGRDVRFKAKQELISYLREQNAQISYILTASTDYVLVSNDIDTYKTRRARQLGIPLVNVEYVHECRTTPAGKDLPDIKRFLVTSAEDKENFSKTGTIPVPGGASSSGSVVKPVKFDVSKIKIWNGDDVELPRFDELAHAEIGKWAIFKETNDHSDVYFVLELQIIPEEYHQRTSNDYRFRFRYEKQTIAGGHGKVSLVQYAFSDEISELHQLFASYYYRIATMPRITRIRDLLPDKLGSKLLLRSLFLHRIDTQMLDDNVCQLIESLWIESIGDLNKILSVRPESIALKTIIEAEAALLEIKSDSKAASESEARFYSLIPHQPSFVVDLIKNRRALIDKIDLCQMLRDMLTINELTNWNIKASIEAKYRALKCHIESIDKDSHEHSTVSQMIRSSTDSNEEVIVHQVYSVAKQIDTLNFRSTLSNQKQLFHGSKYNNFLGILSRGLMMPKMVVDDLGIARTDFGCLGYGIYFSDSVSTSLKYTTPSTTRSGRRLLCISQVALGESAKYYSYAPDLSRAPENYHSTHGVKRNNENNSRFVDDEYVVYNLDQQRLLYIVEVSWKPHDVANEAPTLLPIIRDLSTKQSISAKNEVDVPASIEDEVIQVAEQDYGLICPSSGQPVPLKAFHIRAQLVDVTAEVVLYQVYHNTSATPIEAKYVFPLDENCSVCGFEAHINNKVIKGVVKEKEQAKREYREAIEKGHGAYLMHQEQPEVFSVSVGNLPANCEVIIKITYVAELPIENNDIIFRLPAKVASWQSKQALEAKDQTILPSINLEQDTSSMKAVEFSLKTSIRMPYEISKVFSPTHRLRRKITDCLAMIELVDNVLLEKDFILSITLKSINLPRMLNETYALSDENNNTTQSIDEHSQACMLTFYPKFETTSSGNEYVEVVFIIDVSNSMDGNHVQQAKQLAHLFLTSMKGDDGNIYFNIVTFGSDNDECFPISSPNTKENIEKAKHFILHSLDHRGNTDLFSVLRQYSLLSSPSKLGRQFILLSDGHINDLQSILTLLENQPSMAHDRLFTCSIGDTSNKHNLKQLAHGAHGGGLNIVFDSNYRSRWKSKVLLLLEHIRQPCVTNISIDWHGSVDHQQVKFTNQAPKMIRSLFNGMRLTVYRFIQNCHKATLTAMINDQEFVTTVFSNKITETQGRILHCLTARAIIHDYENGLLHIDESENELIKKQYKQDLIELSMKYSVVSSLTSFVAIEERDGQPLEPGVRLLDVMLENDIDLLPYIGWDGDRSQVEIIKEKLLHAKRLFDSASISSKSQLTTEYEDLCRNISYRAGGDAKYDLMLTIVEVYRNALKENDKARELEEKMQSDLLNEMNNATADEKKALEKRLDEVNRRRQETEKLQSIHFIREEEEDDDDGSLSSLADYELNVCVDFDGSADHDDVIYPDRSLDAFSNIIGEITDVDELCEVQFRDRYPIVNDIERPVRQAFREPVLRSGCVAKDGLASDSDEDKDMGFDCFDDYQPVSKINAPAKAASSAIAKKDEKESYSSDDEEDDCMGFDLFGEEDYEQCSVASVKEKERVVVDVKKQRKNPSDKKLRADDGFVSNSSKEEKVNQTQQKTELAETEHQRIRSFFQPLVHQRSTITPRAPIDDVLDSRRDRLGTTEKRIRDQLKQSLTSRRSFLPCGVPLQPQQQQQQQQMSATPFGFSSPTASLFGNASSVFSDKSIASEMERTTPASTTLFQPFGGFGGYTAGPATSTASFSFGSSTNNIRSSNDDPALINDFNPTTATPPSFAFAPPPPPPYPSQFPVGVFGSGKMEIITPVNLKPMGMAQHVSSAGPPPPRPPSFAAPSPAAGLFGSSQTNASNLFSSTSTTHSALSFSPASAPPPSPPPPPGAFSPGAGLFGSSQMNANASPSYAPVSPATFSFGAPPPPPPAPPQPTLSVPTATLHTWSNDAPPSSWKYSFGVNADTFNQTRDRSPASVNRSVSQRGFEEELLCEAALPSRAALPPMERSSLLSDSVFNTTHVLADAAKSTVGKHVGFTSKKKNKAVASANQSINLTAHVGSAASGCWSSPESTSRYSDTRSEETSRIIPTASPARKSQPYALVHAGAERALPSRERCQDLLLLDVTPLGLGIEDANGQMCTIIPRNCTIPTKSRIDSVFTNAYAYQTTATIRVFQGEHKSTKYNIFLGEFVLKGLTPNFASQTLQISITIDLDANGLIHVDAEEPRSGAKATLKIDPQNAPLHKDNIERHVTFVESDPSFRAVSLRDDKTHSVRYTLKGDTESTKVSFTGGMENCTDHLNIERPPNLVLTSMKMNELKRIQLPDGSFDFNDDFVNTIAISATAFNTLERYLRDRGFSSFALNVQRDIIRLIATGIVLLELFLQVPAAERKDYLVPFDSEQLKAIFRRHLPKGVIENAEKAVDFYEQKRLRCGIYCEQLELKYSSWEKLIQNGIFQIEN